MFLSDFSIKRPISISMIVLGVLLMGVVSIGGIPLSLLPDITFPRVTVRTEYPQAAPAEVMYIGDSVLDQQAAQAAGTQFVAFDNPALEADKHITSLKELFYLLD